MIRCEARRYSAFMEKLHAIIVDGLPTLGIEELADLRRRIDACMVLAPKEEGGSVSLPREEESEFARALYESLAEILAKRTKTKRAPFVAFSKSGSFKEFLRAAQAAEVCHRGWFPKESRAERLSMCALYAELCLDFLEERQQPAFWREISHALDNLPQIIDAFFPGYAESGLLPMVKALRCKRRA